MCVQVPRAPASVCNHWRLHPPGNPCAAQEHGPPCSAPLTPAFSALTGGDTSLWCPSLQEISATFHSLGAHSPALQPLGPTQHAGR